MATIYTDMRDLAFAVHEAISPIDVNAGHVRNLIRDELSRHRHAWARYEDIDRDQFYDLCGLVQQALMARNRGGESQ